MDIVDYIKDGYRYIVNNLNKLIVGMGIYGIIGLIFGGLQGYINIHKYDLHTILTFLSIFIFLMLIMFIVGILITGYLVRICKKTVEGYDEAPDWDNIGELLITGFIGIIGIFILSIIFFIIPIIIIALGIFTMPIGFIFFTIGLVLFFILMIIYYLYQPLAFVNYSVKGFSGFFEFKKIFKNILSLKYLILLFIIFVITLCIGVIFEIFIFILLIVKNSSLYIIINAIIEGIQLPISFLLSVFTYRIVSNYYKEKN